MTQPDYIGAARRAIRLGTADIDVDWDAVIHIPDDPDADWVQVQAWITVPTEAHRSPQDTNPA